MSIERDRTIYQAAGFNPEDALAWARYKNSKVRRRLSESGHGAMINEAQPQENLKKQESLPASLAIMALLMGMVYVLIQAFPGNAPV